MTRSELILNKLFRKRDEEKRVTVKNFQDRMSERFLFNMTSCRQKEYDSDLVLNTLKDELVQEINNGNNIGRCTVLYRRILSIERLRNK